MNDAGIPCDALYTELDMDECVLRPFASGCVAVYTGRAPDKETVNEDAAAVISCGADAGVLAIADGAGGFRAGEQAARIALESLAQSVGLAVKQGGTLRDAILTGIENANERVLGLGVGAATTLAVAEVQGRAIRTYHVGDSMALIVGQRGKLKLQTISHSPVGYAVESGMMDAGEAMAHEERHLISNFVGTPDMRVEMGSTLTLAAHDTVLIASDGLFDNLHVEEIVEHIRCGSIKKAFRALLATAHQRMRGHEPEHPSKPDDLTAVLYRPHAKCR